MNEGAYLRLKDLTKTYGADASRVVAVDNANLEVRPGEFVLIMGPSGAGKTTLLAMCGGLLHPTTGSVWIDDIELTSLGERDLPRVRLENVGFVFQTFNLLGNLSAIENVAVVLEARGHRHGTAMSRAEQMLRSLRLDERLNALPETLSGGEKQRVAIARALINDPALILADEPTGNLDSRTGHEVVEMLEHIAKERGKTVVVVTHDQRIIDVADRVLWLEDGHLQEEHPEDVVLVRDPVCGAIVDGRKAITARAPTGRILSFCSERCVRRYEADPAAYTPDERVVRQPRIVG